MTSKEIEAVLDRVRSWPHEQQVRIAAALLDIEACQAAPYLLSDDEREDILAGVQEADRGEFASEARVRAILSPR